MKNSPWAKLISRATPSISASPGATIAYMDPSVTPCTSCSRTAWIRSAPHGGPDMAPKPPNVRRPPAEPGCSSFVREDGCRRSGRGATHDRSRSIQQRRARGEFFQDLDLSVLHLEQYHVDPGLMV